MRVKTIILTPFKKSQQRLIWEFALQIHNHQTILQFSDEMNTPSPLYNDNIIMPLKSQWISDKLLGRIGVFVISS